MLIVRGVVDDVELTGTLYEPGERPPPFRGAPDEAAPYVWVCDEFYEVESGGQVQQIAGEEVHLAFEHPMPRGFEEREQAIEAAKEHVRTQFARIGVGEPDVEVEVEVVDDGDDDGRTVADADGEGAGEPDHGEAAEDADDGEA